MDSRAYAKVVTAMPNAKLVPELYCDDIDVSLHFYTEVLGFTVLYDRPEERFAYLEREGAELMLDHSMTRRFLADEPAYPYGRGVNLQIEVSDVDSLYETVLTSGATIYLPMEEKWYRANDRELGNRQFVVLDPDGYLLRFFRDLGARPG
jgi:catechol 2,3-dioxygenase-like lactoylglutathione lyase family enzyme